MSPVYRFPPQRSPLSRLLSAIILLAVFAVSLMLGMIVFLAILGALALLAVILYLRFWWLRRRMGQRPRPAPGGVTLEGEYTVSKPLHREDR